MGVREAESLFGVVDALVSEVDEGVVVPVGSVTTGTVSGVDWGAGGRIKGMGAVLPSETVSCSADDAKECHAKVRAEVTGLGRRIVKPLASRSATNSPEAV